MIGSVIGDIVGSVYEQVNVKSKDFDLFDKYSHFTDDSVLTIATADWLLSKGEAPENFYYTYTDMFPNLLYGANYMTWYLRKKFHNVYRPYNSCGNGSAMRVGPVGWSFDTEKEVLDAAHLSAECTHNHSEGIKGAQAIALCIFLARQGASPQEIRRRIETDFKYDMSLSVDEIRLHYSWQGFDGTVYGATCQGSVPEAIICALEATDFEDAVRNAISIGGDSDTIGCMTGSIAEAIYGVPFELYQMVTKYLPDALYDVVQRFELQFGNKVI